MKRMSKMCLSAAIAAFLMGAFAAGAKPPSNPCYTCYLQYNLCLGSYGGDPFTCQSKYMQCMEDRGCVFAK
jgi:hypothetical protein